MDALLRPEEAAKILSVSMSTLTSWRSRSIGPAFFRGPGGIRYRESDLAEWLGSIRCEPKPPQDSLTWVLPCPHCSARALLVDTDRELVCLVCSEPCYLLTQIVDGVAQATMVGIRCT